MTFTSRCIIEIARLSRSVIGFCNADNRAILADIHATIDSSNIGNNEAQLETAADGLFVEISI